MDGNLAYKLEAREEIIDGKVVMMAAASSAHNRIAGNIYYLFRNYLKGQICEPFDDGEGLYLEEGREEYQPDGMVVCDPDKVKTDGVHGAPDLVVEVLSPGTARYDRGRKKDVYEQHGVKEYWIVSPGDRYVEQYVLEEGRFVLRGLWSLPPDFMLKHLSEAERAAVPAAFRCALFDDLEVRLEDVFERVQPV